MKRSNIFLLLAFAMLLSLFMPLTALAEETQESVIAMDFEEALASGIGVQSISLLVANISASGRTVTFTGKVNLSSAEPTLALKVYLQEKQSSTAYPNVASTSTTVYNKDNATASSSATVAGGKYYRTYVICTYTTSSGSKVEMTQKSGELYVP